ncbi:MAG: hypothetical protein Q8881_03370 [Sweet potato little leaf phytoplasma]|nr:hypothetical protein [Sweet potato little leaf phytoplasma]
MFIAKKFHQKMIALLLVSHAFSLYFIHQVDALAITLKDVECLYENVSYTGDIVFGNFVIMDHHVFWRSNHPRIDFSVGTTLYGLSMLGFLQNLVYLRDSLSMQ